MTARNLKLRMRQNKNISKVVTSVFACCSVLQCVAVCCSVLQSVVVTSEFACIVLYENVCVFGVLRVLRDT